MTVMYQSGINSCIKNIPNSLKGLTRRQIEAFLEKTDGCSAQFNVSDSQLQLIGEVFSMSKFIADFASSRTEAFLELMISGDLDCQRDLESYQKALSVLLPSIDSEEELMKRLRIFRNREMVRIAWRDLLGLANVERTLFELSELADASLIFALDFLYKESCSLRGTPLNTAGQPISLVVLGMGKLGAKELNYSSDIDLIFAYSEEGVFPRKREYSYHEFFTVICRKLTKVLNEVTVEGFVFRVDTRLRPFGDSGPLVMCFAAMENYYLTQAREWERYATVKARVITDDGDAGRELMNILNPFTYRRYLDYSAFDSLRSLKEQINKENERQSRANNVKLGSGGIREIEFIGQAFQLIRGGREVELQERGILKILALLGKKEYLPSKTTDMLSEAYLYLRKVENRLQEYADKQTHSLPNTEDGKTRLAWSMGHETWDVFALELDGFRGQVHTIFSQVFESPHANKDSNDSASNIAWEAEHDAAIKAFTALGYEEPKEAVESLNRFKQSLAYKTAGNHAVEIFDRLMPLIIAAVGYCGDSQNTLRGVLDLLEAIAKRSSYLSLLLEHPLAMSQLVKLSAASSWVSQLITRTPILLDDLLDPRQLYDPLSREALEVDISNRLGRIDTADTEDFVEQLLHFKNANVLRVATADVLDVIPLMAVSDYLTDIAEVVLKHVIAHAWKLVGSSVGVPKGQTLEKVGGFAVIAYGKMGGIELSYSSDLDLVFLYNGKPNKQEKSGGQVFDEVFYTRLGRRIMSILNSYGVGGRLYEVDMRLRPSGNSGLLVSSLESFENYQQNNAWVWEHQALVRARFVAGDVAVGNSFSKIRLAVLQKKRDGALLQQEVKKMREKMREALANKEKALFDIKQGVGGIADIEFIVQFLVLSGELCEHKSIGFTDNLRLLEGLEKAGCLTPDEASELADSYRAYRRKVHQLALQEKPAFVNATEFDEFRTKVTKAWNKIIDS